MSTNVYVDAEKVKEVYEAYLAVADGSRLLYTAPFEVSRAYVNNLRSLDCSFYQGAAKFRTPPKQYAAVTLLPKNYVSFKVDGTILGSTVVSIYVDTTTPVYLLSNNLLNNTVGELLFSLDNISFSECILVSINSVVYVKYTISEAIPDAVTFPYNCILIVESSTPINSLGLVTNTVPVSAGEEGGVEIYESAI